MSDPITIVITSVTRTRTDKYPWLAGRPMWHWAIKHGAKTLNDGGHQAMEAEHAAWHAITTYKSLAHDDKNARRRVNRTKREAA